MSFRSRSGIDICQFGRRIVEDISEGLKGDLEAERRGRQLLIEAIAVCEKAEDYVSRHILREIIEDTEEHIDFLETQFELIEKVGLQNYLQSQMEPPSS